MHKFSSTLGASAVPILRLRNRLEPHRVRAFALFIQRVHFHPPALVYRRFVARLAARAFLQSKITHDARLRAVAMALHDTLKGVPLARLFPQDFAPMGAPGEMFRVSLSGWGGDVVRGITASNLFVLPEPSKIEVSFRRRRTDVVRSFGQPGLRKSGFRATFYYPSAPEQIRVFVQVKEASVVATPVHAPEGVWGIFGDIHFTSQKPPVFAYIDHLESSTSRGQDGRSNQMLDFLELGLLCGVPSESIAAVLHPFAAHLVNNKRTRYELLLALARHQDLSEFDLECITWRRLPGPVQVRMTQVQLPRLLSVSSSRQRTSMRRKEAVVTVPEVIGLNKVSSIHGHLLVNSEREILIADQHTQPNLPNVAGQWEVLTGSRHRSNQALVRTWPPHRREIKEAIHLVGRADGNYFHAMVETLPKIVHFLRNESFSSVPFLVSESLPQACLDVLTSLVPRSRIISRDADETILIERLWVPHSHFHLQDSREEAWTRSSQLYWPVIEDFRNRVLARVNRENNPYRGSRVYVRRPSASGTTRLLLNEDQIVKIVENLGFEVIDPSTLDFREQVRVFSGASVICCPGGSGLTNILFCSPATQVVSLIADDLSDFSIFSTIAGHAGLDFSVITGPRRMSLTKAVSSDDLLHSDFIIDPFQFRRQLQLLL